MKVTQAYELVNNSTKQFLGEDIILNNDLSNIVDIKNFLQQLPLRTIQKNLSTK